MFFHIGIETDGILHKAMTLFFRFSPNQWEVPPNCQREPEVYENQFTFLNSFWFTLGALVQQGSDVVPIAFCVRSIIKRFRCLGKLYS